MKFDYKHTFLVGLAFLTISGFWQLYEFVIPLMLRDAFSVNDTISGFVMSLDNILALFLLPLFGALSDNTRTPIGRRMPFVLVGTACSVLTMMLIPLSVNVRSVWLFGTALAIVLISMSVYRSPAVALMPDITPKPLRSTGNAVINLMGAIGGVLVLLLTKVIAPHDGSGDYFPLFAAVAGIMIAGVAVMYFTVDENKLVAEMHRRSAEAGVETDDGESQPANGKKKPHTKLEKPVRKSLIFLLISIALWFMGYNAVTTAFSKYSTTTLGMKVGDAALIIVVAQIVAIISFLPVGMLSSKIGRKRSILVGVSVLTLVFLVLAFFSSYSPFMYVLFALAGISMAIINVNSLPMVVEMCSGSDVGRFTGYYYAFSMSAQIITPILSGILFDIERKLFNTDYNILFPYSAFFVALSFVTMLFVKHGDSKPEPKKSILEHMDN